MAKRMSRTQVRARAKQKAERAGAKAVVKTKRGAKTVAHYGMLAVGVVAGALGGAFHKVFG